MRTELGHHTKSSQTVSLRYFQHPSVSRLVHLSSRVKGSRPRESSKVRGTFRIFFLFLTSQLHHGAFFIIIYLFSEEGRRLAEDLIAERARCQVAKCLSTSKARDQYSPPPSPAPVPAAPRGSQAAPAKVALVGGTQYFFPNSLSICSLFSEVKGG